MKERGNMSDKIFTISKLFILFFATLSFILMIKNKNGNYMIYFNIIFFIAFITFILVGINEFQHNRKKRAILLFAVSLLLLFLPILNIFF